MDCNKETNTNNTECKELEEKLLKLAKVLDNCIENIDNFYCYTLKKTMLAGSNDN